ncbi:START domain-containing protein [Dyadobacter sp. Leaf189]|uniref:START domain-containing protein n=1 Tax=Dyadobacter sp. Leaf189 TaxID=1736295 RepID=UPI0006FD4914|nr:START domain-containing protein [Dyadobacter sp. Leaf189]KQS31026.1 lipid-binding protein [Dyadobacter sp. Leaf189]
MIKTILTLLIVNLSLTAALGQAEWVLAASHGDVRVYSRAVPGSRIKALKAECTMQATMAEVLSLLKDIPATGKWMCHTKRCDLIRQISEDELYYYTEVSLPWPLDNRDFVSHMTIRRDLSSQVVTVNSPAVPGHLPVKKGLVRITESESRWTITPTGNAKVRLEYTLRVDPGGFIPAHIINYFALQAPFETFDKMKTELLSRRALKAADK